MSALGMGDLLREKMALWKILCSEVGLHMLFEFFGSILALVAGVLFLNDLNQ